MATDSIEGSSKQIKHEDFVQLMNIYASDISKDQCEPQSSSNDSSNGMGISHGRLFAV